MKLDRLALVSSLCLVFAAGCASDPNKEVKSAETSLTSEQQKAANDQAELDRMQAEERAKHANADPAKQAELNREHTGEQASHYSDARQNVAGANKDLANAQINMATERHDFEAKVQERLTKADAKAKELKAKSGKLDAKKQSNFATNWKKYQQERMDADARVKTLKSSSDESWNNGKTDVEAKLDQLEATLDKLGSDI